MSEKETPRKGPATSEFWLTLVTSLFGLAIMAGWINPEGISTLDKIAGVALAALTSMGYSISRGISKAGETNK